VRVVVGGLQVPWDVKQLPDGALLITERSRKRLLWFRDGRLRAIAFPSHYVWSRREAGLMSIAVDPAFTRNRRFYLCYTGTRPSGAHDVRVTAWQLSGDSRRARLMRILVDGIQITTGRHAGCRLLISRRGDLYVGTGDSAVGTNPRNLASPNGKVLQLNRLTGAPAPTNPYIDSPNPFQRFVVTYGHRNIQGLAQRGDGTVWSVEHGSFRDDEVNRLFWNGDYGWHPVPGYTDDVPMTDQGLPGTQIDARWRSGATTIATSGAAWVRGRRWGQYDGTLAVACLKGERVMFLRFDGTGRLAWSWVPAELRRFGRLRSVSHARNGDLLLTTSHGTNDSIVRVAPG
jgi:glucose/arabinose dehydrogenase